MVVFYSAAVRVAATGSEYNSAKETNIRCFTPINHHHHHHFGTPACSTHHVAAPPRLLGWFTRRRPSTIRPLLDLQYCPKRGGSILEFGKLPDIAKVAARTAAFSSGNFYSLVSCPPIFPVCIDLSMITASAALLPLPTP